MGSTTIKTSTKTTNSHIWGALISQHQDGSRRRGDRIKFQSRLCLSQTLAISALVSYGHRSIFLETHATLFVLVHRSQFGSVYRRWALLKNKIGTSEINLEKMWAPMSSIWLEFGWTGSTTRNITIYALLNSQKVRIFGVKCMKPPHSCPDLQKTTNLQFVTFFTACKVWQWQKH